MLLRNSQNISLGEIFLFSPISREAQDFINYYRKVKKITSLNSYYRYRKKLRNTGEEHIDEIDFKISEFKKEIDCNFNINFVSEAIILVISSLNFFERKFLTSYFGLNLNESIDKKSSVFVKALNTKNKLLEKMRKPTFLYVVNRAIELNKRKIFHSISNNSNEIVSEKSVERLNGEHRLAIEMCFVYNKRFLDSIFFRSDSHWLFRDKNKLEKIIAQISRK